MNARSPEVSGPVRIGLDGKVHLTPAQCEELFANRMKTKQTPNQIARRLDYLRREIQVERISYAEIAELQSLAQHIAQDDTLLREWAGLPEHQH